MTTAALTHQLPQSEPASTAAAYPSRVLPSNEYVAEAIRLINKAQSRVTIFTMIITQDKTTAAFIDAVCAAAQRGVNVRMSGDIFTLGVMSFETDGTLWRNTGIKATQKMRQRLRDSGVAFSWVGQLGPILYARRTHLKWCIVDDDVFCFGGVNLYKNGINNIDYMILMHDASLADRLESEHHRLHRADRIGKWYRSFTFTCQAGQVLVDGGMFGNSIIYQRACMLATQASHVLLVSQYMPSGRLANILATKQSALYYNRWQSAFGMNRLLLRINALTSKQRTQFTKPGYIHAKFMIFTMPDGHKVAISGSHNFERGGVMLGTREIALETRDTDIITQLEVYHQQFIA
jgi:cardiolipin synthase